MSTTFAAEKNEELSRLYSKIARVRTKLDKVEQAAWSLQVSLDQAVEDGDDQVAEGIARRMKPLTDKIEKYEEIIANLQDEQKRVRSEIKAL